MIEAIVFRHCVTMAQDEQNYVEPEIHFMTKVVHGHDLCLFVFVAGSWKPLRESWIYKWLRQDAFKECWNNYASYFTVHSKSDYPSDLFKTRFDFMSELRCLAETHFH